MKLCVYLDKNRGMMLSEKRQSQDRIQRAEMLNVIGENRLLISKYFSSILESAENIIVDDGFFKNASENYYCFVEDQNIELDNCSTIIIYNWNRRYPADEKQITM